MPFISFAQRGKTPLSTRARHCSLPVLGESPGSMEGTRTIQPHQCASPEKETRAERKAPFDRLRVTYTIKKTALRTFSAPLRRKDTVMEMEDAPLRRKDTEMERRDAAQAIRKALFAIKDTPLRRKDAAMEIKGAPLRRKDAAYAPKDTAHTIRILHMQ